MSTKKTCQFRRI